MDSPICAKRSPSGARIEIYRRFGRIVAPDGEIAMEFAAAHVRSPIDRARWPAPMPPDVPPDAIAIDRYGDYRAGRHTPHGITDAALIAAIRAMQPADTAHMQLDDNGCGVAVVARLTGRTYNETVRAMHPRGSVRIMGTQRLADATGTLRRMCNDGTWTTAQRSGAVAALIRRVGAQWGHYVSITSGGVIVDPELVLQWPIADYPRREWPVVAYFLRP